MELAEILKPIEADLLKVKQEIESEVAAEDRFIKQAIAGIVDFPGKLLHAALALFAFSAENGSGKDKAGIIKIASAIELIYISALAHRNSISKLGLWLGNENVDVRWRDKISVLVGDYLFSRCLKILTKPDYFEVLCAVVGIIARISEAGLEQISMAHDLDLNEEKYLSIIEKKTASLFSFSCFWGGNLGKVAANQVETLVSYGSNFGMAFQMVDDCLKFIGDEQTIGRALGLELRSGRLPLPLIYLLRTAPEDVGKKIVKSILSEEDVAVFVIKEMLKEYHLVQCCVKRITGYVEKAKNEAGKVKNSRVKKSLVEICDYVLLSPLETFVAFAAR